MRWRTARQAHMRARLRWSGQMMRGKPTHIDTHTLTHTPTYPHTHTDSQTHTHTHARPLRLASARTTAQEFANSETFAAARTSVVHAHARTHADTHAHVNTHTYAHVHAHTHEYMYTHAHTHTLTYALSERIFEQ